MPAPAGAGLQPAQVRLGAAPALPRGAQPLAAIASAATLRITVVLKPRDPAALAAYAQAVSTPGSPVYHRYITPAQFARRFGPTRAATAAVIASLRAHGLSPGRRSANGLAISVRADAGDLERAFSLSFSRFALPGRGVATLNMLAPAVDADIAGSLQAVIGLSSLDALRSLRLQGVRRTGVDLTGAPLAGARLRAHVATGGPQPCPAASAVAADQSAYTTDQIASAYGFAGLYQQGDEGQGETIAAYELEPFDPQDIASYQACYGTNAQVTVVGVDGASDTGAGSGEAALDIEQLIAFAPRAQVLVYEGPNSNSNGPGSGPYDVFNAIISQDRAQVVTNSWGNCEPDEGRSDASAESVLFEEAAAQGQTVVSAAGDDGSEDCYGYDSSQNWASTLAVDDPSSQPFVTGVGGTSLQLGPPQTETVWNNLITGGGDGIQPGAGGGGVSEFWPLPGYQSGAPTSLDLIEQGFSSGAPCGANAGDYCREAPDVSADADPNHGYLIYYNGSATVDQTPAGWQGTGGTSGSAPLWAALFALVDADPACHGSALGFVNPSLYSAAAVGDNTYFHDITSGENDFTGRAGGKYPAGAGYNMASGLGSPDAAALAGELCSQALSLADPGAQRSVVGLPVTLQLSAADAPGAVIQFAAGGLPRGLTIDPRTGLISGTPQRSGSGAVTVHVMDRGGSQRAVSFVWTVQGLPTISGVSLTSVAAGRPSLALTVSAGGFAPGIDAISITLPKGLLFAVRPGVWRSGGAARSRYTFAVLGGVLELRVRSADARIPLRFAYDLLRARGALVRSVSSGQRTRLTLIVTVTDAAGRQTKLPVTLRPGS